ncbi:MAG: hypothetical protein ABR909_05415 [Candidatus Bathyarchaeia archaeon]
MEGKNPVEKIIEAISNSMGLFIIMTPNVVLDQHTRDWVVFEIAVAKTKGIPIYCWMDNTVSMDKQFPRLIENITDYDKFDLASDSECIRTVTAILEKAFELSGLTEKIKEPSTKELKEGLIEMDEAKKIATEFVNQEKKPSSVTVNSIEPKGDLWLIKGRHSTRTDRGFSSQNWSVEIKGKNIVSYTFDKGNFMYIL